MILDKSDVFVIQDSPKYDIMKMINMMTMAMESWSVITRLTSAFMKVITRTWEEIGMVKIPVMRMVFHCQGPRVLTFWSFYRYLLSNVAILRSDSHQVLTYLSQSGDNLVIIIQYIP